MPVQLDLLDPSRSSDQRPIWAQLPATARKEIVELFAALLVAAVRSSTTTEEATDEPLED